MSEECPPGFRLDSARNPIVRTRTRTYTATTYALAVAVGTHPREVTNDQANKLRGLIE